MTDPKGRYLALYTKEGQVSIGSLDGWLERVLNIYSVDENSQLHPYADIPYAYVDFEKEMVFEIGDRPVRVVRTPGHSVGSVCFLDEKNRWMFTGDTCCKAHVLLQMEFAAPMQTYKESLEKLIAMESLYDITWPGHHIKPVEKQVIHDFLTAVEGITGGTMEGAWTELPMGKARLLEYKEIGIEY